MKTEPGEDTRYTSRGFFTAFLTDSNWFRHNSLNFILLTTVIGSLPSSGVSHIDGKGEKRMLNSKTSKVCQIVEGKLTCSVPGNKDLFSDDMPKRMSRQIEKLEEKIESIRQELKYQRRDKILETFRNEVMLFKKAYGETPTVCLMNYRDLGLLCDAYNSESSLKGLDRKRITTYSEDEMTRFVDETRISQGCNQEPGEIKFYSAM